MLFQLIRLFFLWVVSTRQSNCFAANGCVLYLCILKFLFYFFFLGFHFCFVVFKWVKNKLLLADNAVFFCVVSTRRSNCFAVNSCALYLCILKFVLLFFSGLKINYYFIITLYNLQLYNSKAYAIDKFVINFLIIVV